jgi:hypothetical protein
VNRRERRPRWAMTRPDPAAAHLFALSRRPICLKLGDMRQNLGGKRAVVK